MPVHRRKDDHVLFFTACGKENIVLRIERKTCAPSAFAGNVVLPNHLHRVGVDDGDGGLVYDVDIDFAVAVGSGLLGRAADVDGAQDRAVLIVEDGDVRLGGGGGGKTGIVTVVS